MGAGGELDAPCEFVVAEINKIRCATPLENAAKTHPNTATYQAMNSRSPHTLLAAWLVLALVAAAPSKHEVVRLLRSPDPQDRRAALDALAAESFCTKRKATAVGLLCAVGRVASIGAQVVNASLAKSPPLLVAVTASLMALGAASVFALPAAVAEEVVVDNPLV